MFELSSLLIIALGVGIGFYLQTIVGFAASLFAFPIILKVLNIHEATGLLAIYFALFSMILITKNWRLINKKIVLQMAPTIIVGMILGVLVLK